MYKYLYVVIIATTLSPLWAQQGPEKADVAAAARLANIAFTQAEIDSLWPGAFRTFNDIKKMHGVPLQNSVPLSLWQMPANPWALKQLASSSKGYATARIPLSVKTSLPANREDLAYYSITQLASLIRNKKISSVELTRFFIDRIKKYSDTLECLITLTDSLAMQQARNADQMLARGMYKGMLHGIPYGLKDLFAVKDIRTTWGAAPYKNQVIDEDAYVYQRLRDAGAVLVGKFTLGALAMGDYWYGGRTRSPWNLSRGSSGSSAGSAAATVAGLVPFAIGTETWGSIISPANACGATGLRPTFGSISRTGAMALSWSLDKIGPICRSSIDAAIVFTYINGTDDNDGIPAPMPFRFDASADPKKLKIGYAKNYFDKIDTSRSEWAVLKALEKAGVKAEPMVFPDDSTVWPFNIMNLVISAECAAAFDGFTRSTLDDEMTKQNQNDWPNVFRAARLIPAVDYINANRHRTLLAKAITRAMLPYDAVIVPTFSGNQLAITNLTGHPAICMPSGFDKKSGMPYSITFLGNHWGEAAILKLAQAYQEATNWHLERPLMFR